MAFDDNFKSYSKYIKVTSKSFKDTFGRISPTSQMTHCFPVLRVLTFCRKMCRDVKREICQDTKNMSCIIKAILLIIIINTTNNIVIVIII